VKKAWQFTLHNLDTMLALVLSLAAAVFGVFGGSLPALVAAIAVTLGLLAYGITRDRIARETLLAEVKNLDNQLRTIRQSTSADNFLQRKTSESSLISQAKEAVWLVQETGSKVIEENFKSLEALIKTGGHVRLITPSNDPVIFEMIALRNKNLRTSDIELRQQDALRKIISLATAIQGDTGSFEVRRLRYPLDITAVFVDPEASEPDRRIGLIRMVGFKNFFDDKRDFHISFANEPETHQHFCQQFLEMWKISEKQDIVI
jgi:hypothetical protein